MMQRIHDVAPGACWAFHMASRGEPDFANGIRRLAEAGCHVILDDARYPTEPMFQNRAIAQAVVQVVSQGIPYFAPAGNYARRSWEAPLVFDPFVFSGFTYHRFGVNSDGSPMGILQFSLLGDGIQRTLVFQEWDEAHFSASGAPGSRSDLDVYFYLTNNLPVARGKDSNIGGNPVETLTVDFFTVHRDGPLPTYLKFVVFGEAPISIEFATNSATLFGHFNVVSAAGVGAAFYNDTPDFGQLPSFLPRAEFPFSCPSRVLACRALNAVTSHVLPVRMVASSHFSPMERVVPTASLVPPLRHRTSRPSPA
jgi:hypothetical protein